MVRNKNQPLHALRKTPDRDPASNQELNFKEIDHRNRQRHPGSDGTALASLPACARL